MKNKKWKILHEFVWYMLIFSVLGLLIETIYCYITTGVLESRKGLILGPVCPIYGVGAVIIIYALNKYKDNPIILFCYGILLGSIAEYFISFILEALYGTRFWEYSYTNYHLNGRICITYSFFWGILSLVMIKYIKPLLDKIINKITYKWLDICILTMFIVDTVLTIWGVNVYIERIQNGRFLVENANAIQKIVFRIEETCFSNNIMKKIFPNIRIIDESGNEIWVRDKI